ncbi:hypothetical protein [Flavobacterium sp. PL02]|uniref:hypothetical protein n=1 Tax=Flavobacterium sp. PL02 TaxID=3088354 RepID=UPI002B23E454|nr:hypothetical protein [Flavobacterium sp. PL02]MEA9412692.1 hypothetical protein [Flavobacterium sp. PL02]
MQKRNSKIYYSAGLISIMLLPILCILYLKKNDAFTSYNSIKLEPWNEENYKEEIVPIINSKKFTAVNLTGNSTSDKAKLNAAEKRIKELIATKDSINGIKFHFEDKSEYWSFIKVLEILETQNAKFYVPYKNDIWFAYSRGEKKKTIFRVCGDFRRIIPIDEKNFKIEWQEIIEITKKFYLPIIAYILMLFFTFKRIRNTIKN